MTDLTIDDLAGSDDSGGDSSKSAEDTAKWLNKLYENLRDDGYLEPLIAQTTGIDPNDFRTVEEISGDSGQTSTETPEATDMEAEDIKDMMLEIYDYSGSIPGLSDDPKLSELIKLIDSNPEMVDEMMDQYL